MRISFVWDKKDWHAEPQSRGGFRLVGVSACSEKPARDLSADLSTVALAKVEALA